jgi:uncharacterized protein
MENASTRESKPVADWSRGVPLNAGPWMLGIYQPSPETVEYWEGVKRNELLVKVCQACGMLHHPRRIVCSECQATDMGWQRASGNGSVYSFSVIHRAIIPELKPSVPYVVGIVRLDEGVHLFTRFISSDSSKIRVGDRVTVDFRMLELGHYLPVFVVAEGTK